MHRAARKFAIKLGRCESGLKKKGGQGIELLLNQQFRLPTDGEAQQIRDALRKLIKRT
jgi:hypothetical protein